MTDLSREELLHAEVLAEFAGISAGVEFGETPSGDRRVSRRRKQLEAQRLLNEVLKAKRHERRKKAQPVKCGGCPKLVRPIPGKTGVYPRWCSSRCYFREYMRARAKICGREWRKVCPARGCGKTFDLPLHKPGRAATYCSKRCQNREACRRWHRRRRARANGDRS